MKSECEDQHAADEPHRPSTAADSCGATLTPQVDDLGHVGGDRYCDAEDPKDLKHGASFFESDCSSRSLPGPVAGAQPDRFVTFEILASTGSECP